MAECSIFRIEWSKFPCPFIGRDKKKPKKKWSRALKRIKKKKFNGHKKRLQKKLPTQVVVGRMYKQHAHRHFEHSSQKHSA